MRKVLYSLTAIILFACNSNNQTNKVTETKDSAAVAKSDTANGLSQFEPQEINWSGFFAIQGKSSWFRKNEKSFCYTLVDETGKAEVQYKKCLFIPYSNETAQISFKGLLQFDGKDSIVVVKEIIKIEQKLFRVKDFSFEYFVKGNEPNWSLEIIKEESVIAFKNFGTQKSYLFNYKEGVKSGKIVTYQCVNENNKLEIYIEGKPCTDGMSDIKYDYSVKVILNGKTFIGCGLSN